MKVIELNLDKLEAFKAYCIKHKFEHDESYLSEEDMNEFQVGKDNPTYLLMADDNIIGVLSVVITDYYLRGNRARIRIFHCENKDSSHYEMLWQAKRDFRDEIKKIEMFLPNKLEDTQAIVKALGFDYYRTSFILVRKDKTKLAMDFEEGYQLKAFDKDLHSEVYATIRNRAFAALKGSETPMTGEMAIEQSQQSDLLKDGMQILFHGEKPVGVVRMLLEDEEGPAYSFVAPIALIPEYQGKGLGSKLLRAGIVIGQNNGVDDSMLCVNGENENALKLYKKEGYELDMSVSCFVNNIRQ